MKQAANLEHIEEVITKLARIRTGHRKPLELNSEAAWGDCISLREETDNIKYFRLALSPKDSGYWRAGFKFSPVSDAIEAPHRQNGDHPLLHLTCNDKPTPVLGVTYYHNGKEDPEASGVILDDYTGTPVDLILYKGEGTGDLIAAVRHNEKIIYARKLTEQPTEESESALSKLGLKSNIDTPANYAFFWVSSWGDQYTYDLNAKIHWIKA